MRWSGFLATLPPVEQERLVNLLTLGLGRLGRAVRPRGREAGIDEVLGGLVAAQDLFRAARLVVMPSEAVDRQPDTEVPLSAPSLSWQRYLRDQPGADGRRLVQLVEWVVVQGQQLGEAVIDDGQMVAICGHLRDVDQGILDARMQIVASLAAPEDR